MDTIDQLMQRITQNLADYHAEIKQFNKQAIIDMAGRISAMNDAHYYLTENHAFTYEDAEYLLKFKNPLEIVADKWETRISDLSDMSFDLDKIFYDKEAENNGYELAGADAEAVDAPTAPAQTIPYVPPLSEAELKEVTLKEAERIVTELKSLEAPNDPDGKYYTAQVSDAFLKQAGFYPEQLLTHAFVNADTLLFGDTPDGKGIYLSVSGDVRDSIGVKGVAPPVIDKPVDVQAEAERIITEIKTLTGPNSPNKTHYAIQVSRDFMNNAKSSDTGKLLKALHFKNAALTSINGEKGIFVTIPKGEVQKPSLLGRLDAAKKDAAAQNQPPGADKSKKVNRGDR